MLRVEGCEALPVMVDAVLCPVVLERSEPEEGWLTDEEPEDEEEGEEEDEEPEGEEEEEEGLPEGEEEEEEPEDKDEGEDKGEAVEGEEEVVPLPEPLADVETLPLLDDVPAFRSDQLWPGWLDEIITGERRRRGVGP